MNLSGSSTPQKPKEQNKKEFTVQLTRNKAAVQNYAFLLSNKNVNRSGGHDHVNARPAGTQEQRRDNYGYYILKRTNDTIDVRPYEGQTREDGKEKFEYVASVFGDRMLLRVETTEPNKKQFLWDTLSLVEKVDSLAPFSGAGSYSLTGEKPAHRNNHYLCSQAAVDSLISAANQFARAKWNTTGNMKLNDMSLEWGGLFDIDGNWNRPHSLHRAGKSVDIENIVVRDTTVTFTIRGRQVTRTVAVADVGWLKKFTELMRKKGWDFTDENQTTPNPEGTVKWPHFERRRN